MCVIISLEPEIMLPTSLLENAVWNNPHGVGLIVEKGKKLEVIREFFKEGTEPKFVHDLLKKHSKYRRHLHLRWKTEGELNLDNTHPFKVHDEKEVWFMHNGTLHEYRPTTTNGVTDPRSDSQIFADRILKPLLKVLDGDYSTDIIKDVILKFWGLTSRGLLVAAGQKPYYINVRDWKTIRAKYNGEDIEFLASNDDYFNHLKRGYEHDRREDARKKKEAEERVSQSTFPAANGVLANVNPWPMAKLKDIDFSCNKDLSEDTTRFLDDFKLWDDEGMAALENMTELEIEYMVRKAPEVTADIFTYLTSTFAKVYKEKLESEEKHDRASKRIEHLVMQLKNKKQEDRHVG